MMNEPISTIMTKELITIGPNDTLAKAHEILSGRRIHHLPVVEGKKLVGLLTTYDLFKIKQNREEYGQLNISEVMTTKLATLEPEEKIGTAAEIFLEHLFHAIPIVKAGALVGIVTTHDLLKYSFKKEYQGLPWNK